MYLSGLPRFDDIMRWGPTYPRPKDEDRAKLLSTPEGREEYRAWQRRESEVIIALKTIVGKAPNKNCRTCKGKGVVPLFTSLAACPTCKPREPQIPAGIKPESIAEMLKTAAGRRKLHQMKVLQDLLKTPEGR